MFVANHHRTFSVFQRFHLLTLLTIATLALNTLNILCPAQEKTKKFMMKDKIFFWN